MFKVEYEIELPTKKKNKKSFKRVLRPEQFETQGKANRWMKKNYWIYGLEKPKVIELSNEKAKENHSH